jgi:hypothetical protein
MKMGGQFAPERRWSVCSGKQPKGDLVRDGQFAPESGGQFDRILHLWPKLSLIYSTLAPDRFRIVAKE